MDGASSSSNASQPMSEARKIEYPCGTDSECLRIKSSATLWLMGAGHHSDPMVGVIRQGEDFSFRMILQSLSPILVTFCTVGNLQWPLTRDTPVLRVGKRSFAFAMPGLLYGLQFSCCCCEEVLENVDRIFTRFGHYENHSGKDTDGTQFSVLPEDDPGFWPAAQLKIQRMVEPFLAWLGATDKTPATTGDTSGRVLRAMRMSAVTKMIAKGVLVGGIDPSEHIELFGPNSSSDEDEDDDIVQSPRASATIFVFSDIVEAMEAYSVIASGRYHSMPPYEPKWTPLPDITFWNINKLGLIRLLQVMVASSAMNMKMMGNSISRMERDVDKLVAQPMDEDLNIMEETKESAEVNKFMEDMANNNDKAIQPIREIRFSIIDEVGNMNGDEKNHQQVEELREACSSMEVA